MKNNEKIWLSSPHMGGSEEKFIKEAFDTNWIALHLSQEQQQFILG
jgi:dTDP-4-amino-4,6-dideoxygalactose transaminase